MALFSAGNTAKSHKSRKKDAAAAVDLSDCPSTVALVTQPPPAPSSVLQGKGAETPPEPTTVPAVDPAKQWWKRPADSKTRKLVEKIVVMRAAGHEDKAIAKKLGTTDASVRTAMYVGRKNGWLDADDESVDLELELALDVDRKIVRNVSASLDGQMTNWQTHEMTIAAAKGRGVFKNHEPTRSDGSAAAMPLVAIQIIMPPVGAGDQLPDVAEDQMGGTPAYCDAIEGEVDEPAQDA